MRKTRVRTKRITTSKSDLSADQLSTLLLVILSILQGSMKGTKIFSTKLADNLVCFADSLKFLIEYLKFNVKTLYLLSRSVEILKMHKIVILGSWSTLNALKVVNSFSTELHSSSLSARTGNR